MTDSLATIITKVQAQLVDDGTLFTTTTVTAAVRQALRDFNFTAPIHAGDLIEVVDGQKVYLLSGGEFSGVLSILDVYLEDDDGDDDEPLQHDQYWEDNRPYIRLRNNEDDGNLLVHFTKAHTVNGLDSEVESTLDATQDQTLVDGACAHAISIRLLQPIETINLNKQIDIAESYSQAAATFFRIFRTSLALFAVRNAPVAEKSTQSWNNDL